MCAKIAVVGLGQGGACAAYHLLRAGHEVTVFERCAREETGYDWQDDIRADIFSLCDMPMPSEDVYEQKRKWLFVSPNWQHSLPVPPLPAMEEISVHRRKLCAYFAGQIEGAGGKVKFKTPVSGLLIEKDKVVGIRTAEGEERFDLVIDASGMRSPLRGQLPKKYCVQAMPEEEGVLYGYRAFFHRTEGADTLEEGIESTMSLKHMGKAGISWCNLVGEDRVDVLIGRLGGLSDKDIAEAMEDLRAHNAILSKDMYFGQRVQICLRGTIPVGVADGYVAVGDSAFETMPLMGSGIESSMKAGKMLADCIADGCDFSAAGLWSYWTKWMKEFGAGFAFIDVLKRWALNVDPKQIDWVFGGGLIEKSDLALVSTDTSGAKPKIPAKSIFKKIGLLLGRPSLTFPAIGCMVRALKAKSCAAHITKKYDEKKIAKWAKKYTKRLGAGA